MAEEANDDPRIGTVLQGRYRVIERLAAGGMGTVYRGERIQLGRQVAIKFLHSSFAAEKEFLRRFEVEARAMSRLSHPHCVSVIDFGVEGQPYMVMDFVHGETLRSMLDRCRIAPARAVHILRQILAGLAHAHGQGIVHRDVKPANIILGEATGTGDHARILDFGLAKLRDSAAASDQSMASMAVGTPSYMSPEQIRGEKVDGRADVYAAGVLFFELLTGKKMFTADETFDILKMHLERPPPRVAEFAPEVKVSSELEAVLRKALEKKPDDRYQTAAAFAEALEDTPEAHGRPRPSTQMATPASSGVPQAAIAFAATQNMEVAKEPSLTSLAAATTFPAKAESDTGLPPPARLETAPPAPIRVSPLPSAVQADERGEPGGGRAIGFLALLIAGAGAGYWWMHQRADQADAERPSSKGGRVEAQLARSDAAVPTTRTSEGEGLVTLPAMPFPDAHEAPAPLDGPPLLPVAPDAMFEEEDDDEVPDASPSEILPPEELDEPIAPIPEASTTPEDQIDQKPKTPVPPPAPPVRELKADDVVKLIEAGKHEEATQALLVLRRKFPKNAYYPYLLGNLYFDKMWWSEGMEQYQAAIRNNRGYSWRAILIKNVIHSLGSEKTKGRAVYLLRKSIGSAALPYLRHAAKKDPNGKIRERAAWLAKAMSPKHHRRRRGRF